MPTGEKPYRVYRGGRVKGRVPLERPQSRPDRNGRTPREPRVRRPRRRWSWRRRIGITLLALLILFVVWAILGYLSFRGGVSKANERLQKTSPGIDRVLAPQSGAVISNPSTILLLGRDFANTDQRVADNHSDSIMILRTDPDHHRLAYLSIPRDLRVAIPGHGEQKINAAMQFGGPDLVVRTIEGVTGNALRINHVMIVDFTQFKQLIDNVGGIDITVPAPILSDKFECPYDAQRCATWKGWRFAKGRQHMDGRRALIYSRIRVNQLDPSDSDIKRGERQQQVVNAAMRRLLGFGTFLKLPFDGHSLVAPLTTDLSAWQFVQLGWVLKRANSGSTLHCRLGGTSASYGSDIIGSEDNIGVVAMVTGQSAPQPPRPGGGLFAPGCFVGNRNF
jgi:polyisoprenyl-teichoic acid--peptidoglycan teichoic acid transferase